MAKFYKVWIHVEECDDEDDDYFENVGIPYEAGEFKELHQADSFAAGLADNTPWEGGSDVVHKRDNPVV